MKINTFARLTLLLLSLSLAFSALAADSSTIYLVRHAEKVIEDSSDPALTKVGQARAKTFAGMLHGKNVTHIFSTPYKRTRDTAAPTSHEHGVLVEEYNPDKGQRLVDKLKTLSGVILVTGHSNTIPRLVNLLVGTSFEDLDERVYDRVYIVTLDEHGHAELEISYSEPRTPTR
ncbi:MAG: broad specificity phosphatase PhoE [Pseudohongiellaceae bacterium]|jgi:broad specificity phosphatase PhoE